MPLIKDGRLSADRYVHLADDEPLPEGRPVLLSASRFLADPEAILRRDDAVGIAWPNNRRVAELAPYADRLALIALNFPTFRDGRAYSQARLLRERYGYRGELRATGQVLRDQFSFFIRAGFDALDVAKPSDADAFAAALARYSVFYQVPAEGRASVMRQRLARMSVPV
jgi:uncharacterized protein (DUF934 family)